MDSRQIGLLIALGITFLNACSSTKNLENASAVDIKMKPVTEDHALDVKIYDSIRSSFSGKGGSYLYPDGELAEQIIEAISIPDAGIDRIRRLSSENIIVSGCRMHSCLEKGAVIVSNSGKVSAAALVHYGCSRSPTDGKSTCSMNPSLTIFNVGNEHEDLKKELIDWADSVEPKLHK